MPESTGEPDLKRAKYDELIAAIDTLFARIPGGLSVAVDARLGRRARRWRTAIGAFAGLCVASGVVLLLARQLALPNWAITASQVGVIVFAAAVVALSISMLRKGATAPQTSTASLRMALSAAVRRARKFEKRHAEELDPKLIAKIRERHAKQSAPPRHLNERANDLADRMSALLSSMPPDGSDTIQEHVFNGRALTFWRPVYSFACWALATHLVIILSTLTFPETAADTLASVPFISALLDAVRPIWDFLWLPLAGVFAALVLFSLATKVFYRDFSADGERAVQLYKVTRQLDALEKQLKPFDETESARIRAAIKFAINAATPTKPVGSLNELKAGLRKAMADAQRRAFIQVLFGAFLAILGLMGLAALLYDTYQYYIEAALGCPDRCVGEPSPMAVAWREELFVSLTASKLVLAVGGNALAFFFLAGFRKSQADARYFRNELTTVEMRDWALSESKTAVPSPKDAEVLVEILSNLGRADRNPVIPAGGTNGHILELRAMNDELRAILQAIRAGNQPGTSSTATA